MTGVREFHATYYNLAFTEEEHTIINMEHPMKNTGMHVCMHFFVFVIKSIHRKMKETSQNTA